MTALLSSRAVVVFEFGSAVVCVWRIIFFRKFFSTIPLTIYVDPLCIYTYTRSVHHPSVLLHVDSSAQSVFHQAVFFTLSMVGELPTPLSV